VILILLETGKVEMNATPQAEQVKIDKHLCMLKIKRG
jgi:hypothetical protein